MKIIWPILILFVFCGCGMFSDGPDLVGDYALWAVDTRDQMDLVKKLPNGGGIGIVGPTVFATGWNNDFIILKQHPGDGFRPADKAVTNFFILRLQDEKLVGPLTQMEFEEQRKFLGVQVDLDFKLIFQDLK